ncbi:hypothetical protein A3850_017590 [Lewinella sp. 4G2]|nr:hypothetical protein A3850_017590 [Lewinella sp. 4G2]
MYAFAQRPDTAVVDEPLYAHYLTHQPTEADHPGREEILASMENDGEKVVQTMLHHDYGHPVVVLKQMTHHLIQLNDAFLAECKNVLLIRSPREIIRSFGEVVDQVTAADVGIPQQHALFQQLITSDQLAAVVDARCLLENPEGVLRQLCERLELPFTDQMLSWPAGPRPEDGVWAQYWYKGTHASTGFKPYQSRKFTLPPALRTVAEKCQPFYEEMLAAALR